MSLNLGLSDVFLMVRLGLRVGEEDPGSRMVFSPLRGKGTSGQHGLLLPTLTFYQLPVCQVSPL